MKKIFVLYASAGQGHTKAAQVVHRYLGERVRDADIRLIDCLEYSAPFLKAVYKRGYDFVIRHAQWLWFFIFYASSMRFPFGLSLRINALANRMSSRRLYGFLAAENPDIIISTHFLPCQVAAELKTAGLLRSCLVTVITDFGVHPFWVAGGTDIYAAASFSTRSQLERMGVPAGKIAVTGIPVAPDYALTADKRAVRAALGIPEQAFTVLLVTGSFGIGPLEEISRLLYKDCHLLVVCARNATLYRRLTAAGLPNVKVFGFVQNMKELMAASDVVVTKPGGLSITELLAQSLIPVFISAIPGQETGNVRALLSEGVGVYCRTPGKVRQAVLDLKSHPRKMRDIRERVARIRKPESAEEIWNAVCARCPGTAA